MDLTVWEVRKDQPVNSLVGTSKFNNFEAQMTTHECTPNSGDSQYRDPYLIRISIRLSNRGLAEFMTLR